MTDHPEQDANPEASPTIPRRNVLMEIAAFVVGTVVAIVPAIPAALLFLNPLLRRNKSSASEESKDDGFVKVGSASGLTPDGPPQMFKVTGIKQDAWTTYPETAIGQVYVRITKDGSIECFNARCPHLGCTVDFKASLEEYVCPCHDSSFDMDGQRANEIPPRNMDSLPCEVRNNNEIWVHFQNFRAGTSEKIPV